MIPKTLVKTLAAIADDEAAASREFRPPAPYFAEGTPAMVELETMVDKVGLSNVLYALAHVCHAKAEHLCANWQDRSAAKVWEQDARKIDKLAGRV